MSAHASRGGLTFEWPGRGKISPYLPTFFFLSLLLHGFGFYVFQVVYPPHVSIAPPPAVVSFLAPTTPENITLLKWIAAEDPAVIATPHPVLPAHLFDAPYRPSFADTRSLPRLPEDTPVAINFPPAKDVLALVGGTLKREPPPTPVVAAPPSELRFSGGVAGRPLAGTQPLRLAAKSATLLEPAAFLIAVAPAGEVQFIFLQQSSGDKAVDAAAETHLARLKFKPDASPLVWGTATFYWGIDAFQDKREVE